MKLFVIYFSILICLGNLLYRRAKAYKEDENAEEKIEEKFNLEHGIVKLSEKFEKRAKLRQDINKMAHKVNFNTSKVILMRKE